MKKLLLLFAIIVSAKGFCQSVGIDAPATADTAFKVYNAGTGPVGSFITKNTDNTGALIYGDHYGKGGGVRMRLLNAQNVNPGIYMYQYGSGDGMYVGSNKSKSANFYSNAGNSDTTVYVHHDGTGMGMRVEVNNIVSTSSALSVSTKGTGEGMNADINNASSIADVLQVSHAGLGNGVHINLPNPANGAKGLTVTQSGVGSGIYSTSEGGDAVWGITHSLTSAAILGDNTFGQAVVGRNRGGSYVAAVMGRNDSSGVGVKGFNTHNGYGVIGQAGISGGIGVGGRFENVNAQNDNNVLEAWGNGTGATLLVQNTNPAATNLAVFKKLSNNVARIDGTGKGFFDGGTQNSGADMAEAFDVTDDINNYEPGDVLIISVDKDRAVEKCNAAYSNLVAGVYATKPGMLMTEEKIGTDISDKLPMGVLGVIPTKVCVEGGQIKRGDCIVTSSLAGVAMKGNVDKIKPGQIIGKALENYSGNSIGKIKVLVNVK